MNSLDSQRWVKLSFAQRDQLLGLVYEDGWVHKATGAIEGRPAIESLFQQALSAAPRERQTRDGIIPVPLAVFLDDEFHIRSNLLYYHSNRDLLYSLFRIEAGESPLQIVIFQQDKGPIPPFNLPLNIRFSGKGALAMKSLIHNQGWGFYDPADEKFGISVTVGAPMQALQKRDILVLKDKQVDAFLSRSFPTGPRFIIILLPSVEMQAKLDRIGTLEIPCLCIGYRVFTDVLPFLREFTYSIIHDLSLHEALYYSTQKLGPATVDCVLFASPVSNQRLRMSAALESYKARVREYGKSMTPGNTEAFFQKLDLPSHAPIKKALSNLLGSGTSQQYIINNAMRMGITFYGESTGLVPLSSEERQFHAGIAGFRKIQKGLSSLVSKPAVFQVLREKQERKVDITLDQFNSSLLYDPVQSRSSLRAGGHYRLNLTIGQLSHVSLISGEIPSIDPLLPDPDGAEGHLLDVVVYPKDFTLLSAARQQVYLPLLGGTDPVQFQLLAPAPAQCAQLRVVVFHRNHLLQAFLLTAPVEEYVSWHNEPVVTAVLDLCTSSKFTNLDVLEPRALYLGMNANGRGTHSIFIKKDAATREIDGLTETVIGHAQDEFRTLLEKAYFGDGDTIRFSSDAQPGQAPTASFLDEIRNFSKFGAVLYKEIFNESGDEIKEALYEIRDSRDEDIQIGRHSMNYAFPWPMIYDYPTPLLVAGGPEAPVCSGHPFGEVAIDPIWNKKGFGCPHNPDVICYCVDGFWGIRHRIEQVSSNDKAIDFTRAITLKKDARLFYSRNIQDEVSETLTRKLQAYVPKVLTIDQNSNLMDLLWDESSRPPTLVVLGHLETAKRDLEPEGPRIITFPKSAWTAGTEIPVNKWIYADLLLDYCQRKKKWDNQPLPLVMLINCDTADISFSSLNSIVKGFHSAGAAAIIGTECKIGSGLGARFIEEVLEAIYSKEMKLGEAIQSFNRRLFASGIPLAFVFTCYGNNSLQISSLTNPTK